MTVNKEHAIFKTLRRAARVLIGFATINLMIILVIAIVRVVVLGDLSDWGELWLGGTVVLLLMGALIGIIGGHKTTIEIIREIFG